MQMWIWRVVRRAAGYINGWSSYLYDLANDRVCDYLLGKYRD